MFKITETSPAGEEFCCEDLGAEWHVDILKKCTVLNIAPGGMELYGKSWNIQTNNK